MKKYRVKGSLSPDCQNTMLREVDTPEGKKFVHINLSTGEISYDDDACSIDENALRDTVKKAGYELEIDHE